MSGTHQMLLAGGQVVYHTGSLTGGTYVSGTNEAYGYEVGSFNIGSYSSLSGGTVIDAYSVNFDGGPTTDEIYFNADLAGTPATVKIKIGSGSYINFTRFAVGSYRADTETGNIFPGSGTHDITVAAI